MRRLIAFLLFIGLLPVSVVELSARSLTPEEARGVAAEFYAGLFRASRAGSGMPELRLVKPVVSRGVAAEAVYAFNAGEGDGFVLVSADDRMRPVVGYATEGRFAYDGMPVQLRALLDAYGREYDVLVASGLEVTAESAPYASATVPAAAETAKAVAPLLDGICWNQDEPFNRLCPMDRYYNKERTPAGCVAVAAAQIMRYHGYPRQGIGSRSYMTDTERLAVSADFASAVYDWSAMLPDYNGGYTEQQAEAVALLLYHVGVACKMDYNYEGSGATAKETAKAFTRYFGYDGNLEYIDRTHYDEPAWDALLRAEIDAGRPVLEFGEGEGGGHAFVCDGYDARGYFHYNWGWGGLGNGYFLSSALEPEYLGIGSGLGAYNHMQSMLTNIQPPNPSATHRAELHLAKALVPADVVTARDAATVVTASFYNYGLRNFTGEAALLLCDDGGQVVAVLGSRVLTNIRELEGGTKATDFAFSVPDEVAAGTYRLYLAHKETGADEYTKMRAPVTAAGYLLVTVSADKVAYAQPAHAARLSLTAKPAVTSALYNGRRASFSVTVRNDGEEFYSYLGILMQKKDTGLEKVRQYVGVVLTRVPKGAVRTFTFSTDSIEVPAGNYDVVAVCDHENAAKNYFDAIGPDELMVTDATVKTRPLLSSNFQLVAPLEIVPADGASAIEPNRLFTVKARLINRGGYGDGSFALIFFDRDEQMIGNSNIVNLSLDRLKTGELNISHALNVPPGQYGVLLASVNGLEASAVDPVNNNGLTFFVSAPTGIVHVGEETGSAGGDDEPCYDLAGRPVKHPAPGIYVTRSGRKILVGRP